MSRRVLVTGGGKGLGAAIVRALAAAGYDVDFTYRSSGAVSAELVAELGGLHPQQTFRSFALDLADRQAVEAFCAAREDEVYYGYVHNAGQSYDTLAATMSLDKADAVMQVNFWSLTAIAKALLRGMLRNRSGRIIAIGSITAFHANAGNGAYAASKGAIASWLRTLAIETARRGVTVNTIAPGYIDTDMMARYARHREALEKQIPVGRFARPDEVAAMAAFLMGDSASYVTGAVLPVDGGLSAQISAHRS
ncbi:SDR family NAD(P)-dependent oxidoreductase [Camelimonas abortus]|uniref:SDR family NAD(P)-dependent oxidoreductase n=1 Tax=Camelimonas abortus TaxID=1017184 RepID=A0ABV7LCV2_9HYPH